MYLQLLLQFIMAGRLVFYKNKNSHINNRKNYAIIYTHSCHSALPDITSVMSTWICLFYLKFSIKNNGTIESYPSLGRTWAAKNCTQLLMKTMTYREKLQTEDWKVRRRWLYNRTNNPVESVKNLVILHIRNYTGIKLNHLQNPTLNYINS